MMASARSSFTLPVLCLLLATLLSCARAESKEDPNDPFYEKCTKDEDGKVDHECVDTKMAIFSGGGFMRLRDHMRTIRGVRKVNIGYTGGFKKNFTYEQVCLGGTGHTEVVQIFYDSTLSYETLCQKFFDNHDATHRDHIGNFIGWHYRSAVFFRNAYQEATIKKVKELRFKEGDQMHPIVTDIEKFDGNFYLETAEDHELWEARKRADARVDEYKRALNKPDDVINAELKKNYDSPSFTHLSEEIIEHAVNKSKADALAEKLREEKEREEELHQAAEHAKAIEKARTIPPPYKDKDGNMVHYGTPNPNEIDIVEENDKKYQKEEAERLERIRKKALWDQENLHKKHPPRTPNPPTTAETQEPDTPLPEEERVRLEAPVGKEEEAVKAHREKKAKEAKEVKKTEKVEKSDDDEPKKIKPPPPVQKKDSAPAPKKADKAPEGKADAPKKEAEKKAPPPPPKAKADKDKEGVPPKEEKAKPSAPKKDAKAEDTKKEAGKPAEPKKKEEKAEQKKPNPPPAKKSTDE